MIPMRRREPAPIRWLFATGDPRRLAALRIGLCATLAVRLGRDIFVELADQPSELFRPLSFMQLLPAMPSRGVALTLQIVGIAAAAFAAVGLLSRLTVPVAWACGALLIGMATSLGKVVHNDVLLLLAMVPLLPAPTGDAWSLYAFRREPPPPRPSVRYGWPVRTAAVVVAGSYFFTGLAKVVFSGPAWFASDNLRFALYASSDAQSVPNAIGLFVADRQWLAHAVAAGVLVFELAFPIVLWWPRWAWAFVLGAAVLHLGIWTTMHLDYSAWIATVAVVLLDWPRIVDRLGTARGRSAPDVPRSTT
jgi:hypothetical protein